MSQPQGQTLRFRRVPIGARAQGHWLNLAEYGLSDPQAPTIFMIHGAAGSWHNWRLQMERFSTDYRVLAPDLRGHGISPWPGVCHIQDFVDDLEALLDVEVPGSFNLFSHSFGGGLAAYLYERRPQQIQRMALLNTGGHIPQGLTYRVLQLMCHKTHWARKLQPYAVSCDSPVAVELLHRNLKEWQCWEQLRKIQCPTAIVLGRHDRLIPHSFATPLREAIPHADLHILNGCGHVCMWETPDALQVILERLLSAPAAATAESVRELVGARR